MKVSPLLFRRDNFIARNYTVVNTRGRNRVPREYRREINTAWGAPGSASYKTRQLLFKRWVRCYQTKKLEEEISKQRGQMQRKRICIRGKSPAKNWLQLELIKKKSSFWIFQLEVAWQPSCGSTKPQHHSDSWSETKTRLFKPQKRPHTPLC